MINIRDFEGIAGFRWGAHVLPDGHVELSLHAPQDCRSQIAFMERLLKKSQTPLQTADFVFERGKVLLRSGGYGTFILFCDIETNTSLYGFVLDDASQELDVHHSENEVGSDTNSGELHISESMTIQARPIPGEIIETLMAYYIEVLGPLAPALAKKESAKHHIDLDRVLTNQWANLLNILADRISDKLKSEAFLDRAVMLKTRF